MDDNSLESSSTTHQTNEQQSTNNNQMIDQQSTNFKNEFEHQNNKNENYLEDDSTKLVKQEQLDDYEEDKNSSNNEDAIHIKKENDELFIEQDTSNEAKQSSPQSNGQATTDSYTDFGGVNLEEFLFNLLQNNPKDRVQLLKIEQELIDLVKDESRTTHKFPPMSSYHRMLVHRVAAYFGLEHNIDSKGTCIVVDKQEGITRIPELKFKDQMNKLSAEEPKKLILKRNTNSMEAGQDGRGDSKLNNGLDTRRAKSFEERNEHYEKVKARIFNQNQTTMKGDQSHQQQQQLGNIDESDLKCNSDSSVCINNGLVNENRTKSINDSSRNFNYNSNNHQPHFDSGHSSYFNNNHHAVGYSKPFYDDNHYADSHDQYQFNQQHSQFSKHQPEMVDGSSSKLYYKSNGFKGKPINKNNLKNNNQHTSNKQQPPHFYQPAPNHLPPQMLNHPLDQQQMYSTNWLPTTADHLNAQQDCYKQMYQPAMHYNQITHHPNQQKLFLLCNYPETHSYGNDKMVPNPVVLSSANANMNHLNGQLQANHNNGGNKMDSKENMNSFVTAQMSNLSLGHSMNAADINDVQNRTSTGIPICYVKSPYYPIPGTNQLPNDIVYQNSLASRAHLQNHQQMLLFNQTFNRPNHHSILPAPQQQSIGMTNNPRFTNPNYSYTVNGSTSHEMNNQIYPHMPPYMMPNTIRPQQSPLLPTPVNPTNPMSKTQTNIKHPSNSSNLSSKKKVNDNQSNEQVNGFIKNDRKKMNGYTKNMDKKLAPIVTSSAITSIKPKTSNNVNNCNNNKVTTSSTNGTRPQQNGLSNELCD